MTTTFNQSYVVNYLSPKLKEYAVEENIENRFLHIVDSAPSLSCSMDDWADNIDVMSLPPNTTVIIQSMNQGVISAFKGFIINGTQCYSCLKQ